VLAVVRKPLPSLAITILAAAAAAQERDARLTIEREIVLRTGASRCVVWSRDGRLVASGGECGDVRIVDAATSAVVREVLVAPQPIDEVSFSPDATSLAVCFGGSARLVDVASGAAVPIAVPGISAFAWSGTGEFFAVVGSEGSLVLHRTHDRARLLSMLLPKGTESIAFSPDDLRIAAGTRHGNVLCVVSRVTGAVVQPFATPLPDELIGTTNGEGDERPRLRWTKRAAAATPEPAAAERLVPQLVHRARPRAAAFAGKGQYVAIVDGGEAPQLLDVATGAARVLPDAARGVPVQYGASDHLALWRRASAPESWARDRLRLELWSLGANDAALASVRDVPAGAVDEALPHLDPSGRFAATAQNVFELRGADAVVWGVAVRDPLPAPDGMRAAAVATWATAGPSTARCEVQVLRCDGTVETKRRLDERAVMAAWSPDGARLALLTTTGLHVLDPATLADVSVHPGAWSQAAFVDAERVLLLHTESSAKANAKPSTLTLLDLVRGAEVARAEVADATRILAVSDDGSRAVLAHHDRATVIRLPK